jgi:hypothetical protein
MTFPGDSIATLNVIAQFAPPIGRHHETFVLVKQGGEWLIRVHQMVR